MSSPEDATPPPLDPAPIPVKGTTAAVIQTTLVSVALAVATVLGATGTLLSFIKTRDLAGWIVWLRSSEATMVITALMTIGGFLAIAVRSARRKWREIFFARHAPDTVAYIVGEQSPALPDSRTRNGNASPPTRLVSIMQGPVHDVEPDSTLAAAFSAFTPPPAMVTPPPPPPPPPTDDNPGLLAPKIDYDALSIPVVDLREPKKED